jgi:hypothetical protein
MRLKRNWAKVLAVTPISTAVVSVALRAQRAGTPSLGRRGIAQTVGDFFIERLPEWDVRRIDGDPGVCFATAGPGASHLVTGL